MDSLFYNFSDAPIEMPFSWCIYVYLHQLNYFIYAASAAEHLRSIHRKISFYFLFSLHCFKWSRSEQILSKGFQTLTSWPLRFFRVNITELGSSNIILLNLYNTKYNQLLLLLCVIGFIVIQWQYFYFICFSSFHTSNYNIKCSCTRLGEILPLCFTKR